MLVADADGHRHRHDAAQHCGPEGIDKLLIAVQQQNDLVARLSAQLLQMMQQTQCAVVELRKAELARIVLAVVKGDAARRIAIERHQLGQGTGLHGVLRRAALAA